MAHSIKGVDETAFTHPSLEQAIVTSLISNRPSLPSHSHPLLNLTMNKIICVALFVALIGTAAARPEKRTGEALAPANAAVNDLNALLEQNWGSWVAAEGSALDILNDAWAQILAVVQPEIDDVTVKYNALLASLLPFADLETYSDPDLLKGELENVSNRADDLIASTLILANAFATA